MTTWDTIIIGAGNAAFCAAHAAREQGASVLMLEAAPEDENGGNSRYTAGAIRFAYDGVEDIRARLPRPARGSDPDHRFWHLHRRTGL